MNLATVLFTLVSLAQLITGAFIPCSLKDPKLNECIVDKINKMWIPNFEKAYPQLGVPVLDPHALGNIKITQGNKQIGLNFTASDVLFYGLKDCQVQKVDFNPKAREFSVWYHNNRFVQLNNYEAKGKILLFPINGHGKGNITTTNVNVRISLKYNLASDPKTKVKHIKVKSFDFKAKAGKGFLNFENIFNGDAYLSKQINDVINDSSEELMPTFQPSVETALSKAWKKICEDFFSKMPYDDLFLP